MSTVAPPVSRPPSVAVLDSAITWTHSCLQLARLSDLARPTPCHDWDLGRLLAHMDESLVAIAEAAELGHVDVDAQPRTPDASHLVDRIVQRACRTRAAWRHRPTSAPVTVGDLALGRDTVALVGAAGDRRPRLGRRRGHGSSAPAARGPRRARCTTWRSRS